MMVSLRTIEFLRRMVVMFSILLLLLPPLSDSAPEPTESVSRHRSSQRDVKKQTKYLQQNSQLISQMRIHGFLLWASMGFFLPLGVLAIKLSSKVQCGKSTKMLFYFHVILQMGAVFLAIAGAVLAVKNFENAFNNAHQRLGMALYGLMLLQPLIGFCRPHRGDRWRSVWYFVHWFVGTGVCVMAIANVYLGLHAYHAKTLRNTRIWIILFTAEVSILAFVYLLLDKWDYMLRQEEILSHDQIMPADRLTIPSRIAIKVGGVRNGAL